MTTRRDLLKSALAWPTMSLLSNARAVTVDMELSWMVVRERKITESSLFASALSARACLVVDMKDDPAEAWREIVSRRVQKHTALAGCTRESTAFVLSELARAEGLHLQKYATHQYIGTDRLEHRFDAGLRLTTGSALDLPGWPGNFASLLRTEWNLSQSVKTVDVQSERPAQSPGFLCSWILT